MNRKQKICLAIGVTLIALIGFFPPSKLPDPKFVGPWLWWEKLMMLILHKSLWNVRLHYLKCVNLFIEWFIVAVITVGLVYVCRDKKPKGQPKR